MDSSDDSKKNFFKHVFNFDDDSKSEMLNIVQYTLIGLIPIILLNKTMQKYVPEADDNKGSAEVLAEVIVQIIIMFMGLLIIHRIITFVPTYSGMPYPDFSVILIILATLMIILSLQTKLGEKVSILVDRIVELWEGPSQTKNKKDKGAKNSNIKVSQPISGQMNMPLMNSITPSSSFSDGTSINSLPTASSSAPTMSPQQLPNYNNMYRNDANPLVGAATPGQDMGMIQEPMAANSVLGGSAFGSW
jgi:hypothetical protein